MTETNPWASVKPLTPNEAAMEMAFIFIDIAQGDATSEVFTERLVELLNGVYLSGWQSARETVIQNAAQLIADIYADAAATTQE